MKNGSIVAISALVLLGGGYAGYSYWQHMQAANEVVDEAPASTVEAAPEVRLVIDPAMQTRLPALDASDDFIIDAMSSLLGSETLMAVLVNEKLIQKIVSTIDNLPSKSVPREMMPIVTAEGVLITLGPEGKLTISPKNAERYTAYMKLVDAIDAGKLVKAYLRFYPLFQQAYEELGYPDKYFNDRLMIVINDLLAAPDVVEPVKVVQPLVVYQFADTAMEAKNIGQRIMLRIGSKNEAKLKDKLRDIRKELLENMREIKLVPQTKKM